MHIHKQVLTATLILLSACGGDDSSSRKLKVSDFYHRVPNIQTCDEGVLKDEEKQKALALTNQIRSLHNLKPVTYNFSDDVYTAKSALITAANAKLEQHPTMDYKCWTPEGEFGSKRSNLYISFYGYGLSPESVDKGIISFLTDDNVESLGDRRWLINPFLSFISYGRVDATSVNRNSNNVTAVSLKLINDENAYIADSLIDFVAYPYEEYPDEYFKHGWYMSFSVLADTNNFQNNQDVDFSNAQVEIYEEGGSQLSTHSISFDNSAYGLQNLLKWKVDGIINEKNTRYI